MLEEVLALRTIVLNVMYDPHAGRKFDREVTSIWLQRRDNRRVQNREFKSMARGMADRYLRLMDIFSRHGITSLGSLLDVPDEPISQAKTRELHQRMVRLQRQLQVPASIRRSLEEQIASYCSGSSRSVADDLRLGMLRILMCRYARRTPQVGLFETPVESENTRPLRVNADLLEGAKVQLMHEFGRPYYFGVDVLCDGSSENAEQFLQLAGRLVGLCETRIIRSQHRRSLPASVQHRELRNRTLEMMDGWRFPERRAVQILVKGIAEQCLGKALEPNASLGPGPNAFGLPQDDFESIPERYPYLAEALKFGLGYNAINIKQKHSTKHSLWALIELGGVAIISSGLAFRKGNFLERSAADLESMLVDRQ